MLKIKDVGEVISDRDLLFIQHEGKLEQALIRIGKPYKYSEDLNWCCPYEIVTKTHRTIRGTIGIDSLQTLELTMKSLLTEIEYWESSKHGKFRFLDEDDAGFDSISGAVPADRTLWI